MHGQIDTPKHVLIIWRAQGYLNDFSCIAEVNKLDLATGANSAIILPRTSHSNYYHHEPHTNVRLCLSQIVDNPTKMFGPPERLAFHDHGVMTGCSHKRPRHPQATTKVEFEVLTARCRHVRLVALLAVFRKETAAVAFDPVGHLI